MTVTMIGLDTAKSAFQIHGIGKDGKVELKRKLQRREIIALFEQQPRCTVVMEACGSAHRRARLLGQFGFEVKLIAPEAVRPFVKRGKKNDAADAAAICTAATRPDVKFVAVKSTEQQAVLTPHSAQALLVKQQTMLANAVRGLAAEFGLVQQKGKWNLEELATLVEDDEAVPGPARRVLAGLFAQLRVTGERSASRGWRRRSSRTHERTKWPAAWPQSPGSGRSPPR